MRKLLLYLVAITVLISSMGCETTRGVGKDIEDAGEELQEAVR